jgi:hypothetical protein
MSSSRSAQSDGLGVAGQKAAPWCVSGEAEIANRRKHQSVPSGRVDLAAPWKVGA